MIKAIILDDGYPFKKVALKFGGNYKCISLIHFLNSLCKRHDSDYQVRTAHIEDIKSEVTARWFETARHIHPGSTPGNPVVGYNAETYRYDKAWYESDDFFPYLVWTKPEYVKAEFIGTTDLYSEGTVLCASFNAG